MKEAEVMSQLSEVDRNYEAFLERLPALLKERPGQHALMHDAEIIEFFETAKDAIVAGIRTFGQGSYSVQEVSGQAEDLGFYSYAGSSMQA